MVTRCEPVGPLHKGPDIRHTVDLPKERNDRIFFFVCVCVRFCEYSGTPPLGNFVFYRMVALFQGLICTKRVHLGLSKVAFTEGRPHVRGGLYEGLH